MFTKADLTGAASARPITEKSLPIPNRVARHPSARAEATNTYRECMKSHAYTTHLVWEGSTGAGYRGYSRSHRAVARPAVEQMSLSADPQFRGDPDLMNPEQLLVMATSSCQLLSFLAVAAQNSVDVVDYEDDAVGIMSDDTDPTRIASIELSPVVRVAAGTDHALVMQLIEEAHRECYIANSLTTSVSIIVTVVEA